MALANGDIRLRSGLEQLYDLFQKAPELGSLINPRQLSQGDLVTASFAELQPLLTRALQSERAKQNHDLNEIGVAAQGMAQAACFLNADYHVVITNVPYLARGKQNEWLKQFCECHHSESKADLASVFLQRCRQFCADGGSTALVTPQNWLFLGAYRKMRQQLLNDSTWNFVAKLGPAAFEDMNWWAANTMLSILTQGGAITGNRIAGVDVSAPRNPRQKSHLLSQAPLTTFSQSTQLKNPDARIALGEINRGSLLAEFASCFQGICTGDFPRFGRNYWEMPGVTGGWVFQQTPVRESSAYGGCENALLWENGEGSMYEFLNQRLGQDAHGAWIRGMEAWGKNGVAIGQMRNLPAALYKGEAFDNNVAVIVPDDEELLPAIWAFCCSAEYATSVRAIDQSLKVTNQTLLKVSFDVSRWRQIAAERLPEGLPKPSSNDPKQWLFAGHPVGSTAPLQVCMARLLGYRWPRQTGQTVSGAPPVPGDNLEVLMDEDGIVCIPSIRGEQPASDRLRGLLLAAYGNGWSPTKQDELLAASDYGGRTLEDWLRNGFFEQHSKLFHHRPFIWQIWDGRKDGFSVLVNYHKLDHKRLEKLTYTYLGDWIKRQQESVGQSEAGADDRLLKAQQLQDRLKLILEGESPYDIFVRWKPIEQQSVGWNPDLNDGVRLNIRPFIEADILRKRPNIKWTKDRGTNPPGSLWGEERINDRHLTLEQKLDTRKK